MRTPDVGALADALVELGKLVHLDLDEGELVARFLAVLAKLLPGRAIAIRVGDPRSVEPLRAQVIGGALRTAVVDEAMSFLPSAVAGSGMKSAVAASARVRVGPRWDAPFHHVASGFAVPLVAAGELYGALDVGYTPDPDLDPAAVALDEKLVLPIANQLAVALRGHQLFRESAGLRDFTARLIEHANALIVGIDHRWRITVANRAMLALTGFARDEVVGHDLRDFLPRDQRARLTRTFTAALRGESQDAVDVLLATRAGGRVRTMWSIAAIGARIGVAERSEAMGGGSPAGFAGRAGGEAPRGNVGPSIEAVVAIGQDQSKLEELQKQVVQAERLATLGQLAAGVVHELNNPLTSITVYADYLLGKVRHDANVPEPDKEKLRRILSSAQRILRFTRELVQYAKPVGSEVDTVDVNDVVRQAVSFCEHLFERAAIQLQLDFADDVPPLHAVPGQLEQVLINLVTNAAHAVEQGGVVVIRTRTKDRRVSIEVADSGPGVPELDRERIFEPFFTTKTDGKGTGLGLPIVKNIIEQHQGTVSVGAAPEGGASFLVILPAQ